MSGKAPFKLRRTVLIAAALIVIAVVAGLQMRSHRTAPSSQAGEQGPTITAPENPTPTPNPTPATTETDTSTPTETTPPAPTQTPLNPDSTGVTVKGAVGEKVLPDVPQKATDTIHGKFELSIRVTVGSDGIVSNAALASPGPSRYFANLSLQAARNWKFKPAQVNGQAVPSSWLLRFQFSQTATEVTSVEESP
jgi:protein TonB